MESHRSCRSRPGSRCRESTQSCTPCLDQTTPPAVSAHHAVHITITAASEQQGYLSDHGLWNLATDDAATSFLLRAPSLHFRLSSAPTSTSLAGIEARCIIVAKPRVPTPQFRSAMDAYGECTKVGNMKSHPLVGTKPQMHTGASADPWNGVISEKPTLLAPACAAQMARMPLPVPTSSTTFPANKSELSIIAAADGGVGGVGGNSKVTTPAWDIGPWRPSAHAALTRMDDE